MTKENKQQPIKKQLQVLNKENMSFIVDLTKTNESTLIITNKQYLLKVMNPLKTLAFMNAHVDRSNFSDYFNHLSFEDDEIFSDKLAWCISNNFDTLSELKNSGLQSIKKIDEYNV